MRRTMPPGPLRMTGAQLRKWRILKAAYYPGEDWTQDGAATWYGVHVRTWRKWELGEVPVPYPLIRRALAIGDAPALLTLHGQVEPAELARLTRPHTPLSDPLELAENALTDYAGEDDDDQP